MSPSDLEPDIDPQGIWQSQKKEYDPMTLAQIHAQATSFEKFIERRNAREYLGSAPASRSPASWPCFSPCTR